MNQSNTLVSWRAELLKPYMLNAVNWIMEHRITPLPALQEFEWNHPSADWAFYDSDYTTLCGFNWHDPGEFGLVVVGMADCIAAINSECLRSTGYFDNSKWDSATAWERRRVVCHEIGHMIGLPHDDHPNNSCMIGVLTGSASYSWHERNLIDDYWG